MGCSGPASLFKLIYRASLRQLFRKPSWTIRQVTSRASEEIIPDELMALPGERFICQLHRCCSVHPQLQMWDRNSGSIKARPLIRAAVNIWNNTIQRQLTFWCVVEAHTRVTKHVILLNWLIKWCLLCSSYFCSFEAKVSYRPFSDCPEGWLLHHLSKTYIRIRVLQWITSINYKSTINQG